VTSDDSSAGRVISGRATDCARTAPGIPRANAIDRGRSAPLHRESREGTMANPDVQRFGKRPAPQQHDPLAKDAGVIQRPALGKTLVNFLTARSVWNGVGVQSMKPRAAGGIVRVLRMKLPRTFGTLPCRSLPQNLQANCPSPVGQAEFPFWHTVIFPSFAGFSG
jgi:hypothetical protein